MKNTRRNSFSAILLAVLMVFATLPVTASANWFEGDWPYTYDATSSAVFTFASNETPVSGVDALTPGKASTMTIDVPDSKGLPGDQTGEIVVTIPENVIVTSDDAAKCDSLTVTCAYRASSNQLVFKWSGEPQAGFTATLPITPNTPATRGDISGTYVLTIKNGKGTLVVVQPNLKNIDGVNRLTCVEGTILYNSIYRAGTDLPEWDITHYSGDWYSISCNGQYINFGDNGNNISLSSTPQYFLYTTAGAGDQFVAFAPGGTNYYINNKSDNVSKGIQASTYNNQCIMLLSELKASDSMSLVMFDKNGGSLSSTMEPVMAEKGSSITLPEFPGTRSGYNFLGWATKNNLKTNTYTEVYKPGESYKVESDQVTLYAIWSSTTPERVQFGIRLDGEIPDEPAQYALSSYSKEHIYKDAAVIDKKWIVDTNASGKAIEGNHVVNSITKNLNILPTDEELKSIYPAYDPATMYVHWYVLKYAGQWKVDGVVIKRPEAKAVYEVRYDAGVATENKKSIKNIPATYRIDGGSTVKVGTGSNQKAMKAPEYPEHIFKGWNTAKDGTGQSFQSGDTFAVDGDVTFFAQWEEIPTYKVSYGKDNKDNGEYYAGDTVTLAAAQDKEHYFFSGWLVDGTVMPEGTEFVMPDKDLDVTPLYYGPIDIDIVLDWPKGQEGYYGAQVPLRAILRGASGLDCTLQWQYLDSNGEWVDQEGAHETSLTYTLNAETANRTWRVIITHIQPKQN